MANIAAPLMFKRIARVDEVMRLEGWNLGIVDRLAEELGVDRATVYKLRRRAEQWTQGQMRPQDSENWRAKQMQALTETALEARKNKDYSAAVRAIEIQAKIVGTIAPTKVDVTHTAVVPANVASVVANMAPEQIRALTERRVIEVESAPVGAVGSTDDESAP